MKLTDFIQDIGRPVAFYPGLRKITGSTTATLFLCQLIYWNGKQSDPEGWIYKTSDEIEDETGLSYDEQSTARKHLIQLKFIEEKYKRLDHKMTFKIMSDNINDEWRKLYPGIPESRNTALGKAVSDSSLNGSSEITPETTSKKIDTVVEKASTTTRKNLFPIANALAQVTGMDMTKNGPRLFKEAKAYKADEVEEIIQIYGPGGAWYELDWRGKKGEKPRLENIRETWGRYKPVILETQKKVKSVFRDGQWWMEYVDEP